MKQFLLVAILFTQAIACASNEQRIQDWVDGYLYAQITLMESLVVADSIEQYRIVSRKKTKKHDLPDSGNLGYEVFNLIVKDLREEAKSRYRIDENGSISLNPIRPLNLTTETLEIYSDFAGIGTLKTSISQGYLFCEFRRKNEVLALLRAHCSESLKNVIITKLQPDGGEE